MGLFDKLTGKARREEEARLAAIAEAEAQAEKERKAEERKAKKEAKKAEEAKKAAEEKAKKLDPKAQATAAGEPYVSVLSMDLDPENPGNGAFELDWNDKFLAQLVRAGYQRKPNEEESVIVDRWFQDVCRNVVMENFEQEMADPEKRAANQPIQRRDLGGGKAEFS